MVELDWIQYVGYRNDGLRLSEEDERGRNRIPVRPNPLWHVA